MQCRPGCFKLSYDTSVDSEPVVLWEVLGMGAFCNVLHEFKCHGI